MSNRQKKRKKRNLSNEEKVALGYRLNDIKYQLPAFIGSRPNRRAKRRLDARIKGYETTMANLNENQKRGFTKPASIKHW